MSIFNVNFTNFGNEQLPPDKRNSRLSKLVFSLLSQIQYLRDIIVGTYMNGATYAAWAAAAYSLGARVTYKHSVYESLINGNIDTPPSVNWFQVQQNAIGITEQNLYTTQKISLEYALNRWFGTNFLQPPLQSDIYLTLNNALAAPFTIGATEANSSQVYLDHSSAPVVNVYSTTALPNLNINIPIAVWTALDSIPSNRNTYVSAFVNQYLAAGITYTIQTY